ncbi:unnamed protein product [Acanthoscelides obtectus]|uniref:Uncharacterized protein n=1 Tax=Acanthoscelides obtectus TaxID=200917 RepID=A0A9P0M742_ACAOB|nr:unnamed protein product [Acanthoscelides obtectus]CAK1657702.1 hypothetical protein AOBTE_LOCUS20490 [Acanthoscelides obtectus]
MKKNALINHIYFLLKLIIGF